jgi:peptidoglycan/xylan/chitin deacetylase (PgdA/CDA1 family)
VARAAAVAYHAVTTRWPHPLAISPERLRLQLTRLAERGLRGVTLAQAGERDTIAITFDDGFSSVASAAKPILDELGWRATVFVVTDAVGSGRPMLWLGGPADEAPQERLPLTWEEVEALADAGWEIGSHSRTHRLLSALSDDELDEELAGSRDAVVGRVGACASISYPFGELDDRVVAAARRAGYSCGSGLAGRFVRGDELRIPRVAISGGDDSVRFALKTSSLFGLLRTTPAWTWLELLRRPGRPLGVEPDRARPA